LSISATLDNRTPFAAKSIVLPDAEGQEVLLVLVCATFVVDADGLVRCADAQRPAALSDVYRGAPGLSSLLREADLALEKPAVDVLVNGTAYAPGGRPAKQVPVGVLAGDVRKQLLISGDRGWRTGPLGRAPSSPKPFDCMPIVYERSFGGAVGAAPQGQPRAVDARNPIGVGFEGARSMDLAIETELPNVESPTDLVYSPADAPTPSGLGAVGRGWSPRVRFAGTYDEAWRRSRWPFLPLDFDARFNQSAPPDQQSRTLQGGEMVRIVNLTPEGEWSFRLPKLQVPIRHFYDDRHLESHLRVDTVLIEPDARTVVLTGRSVVRTVRNTGALREVVIGHVTPAWLRARVARKLHVDHRRGEGEVRNAGRHFEL